MTDELDVASHIVTAERLGDPATNQELFTVVARGRFVAGIRERLQAAG